MKACENAKHKLQLTIKLFHLWQLPRWKTTGGLSIVYDYRTAICILLRLFVFHSRVKLPNFAEISGQSVSIIPTYWMKITKAQYANLFRARAICENSIVSSWLKLVFKTVTCTYYRAKNSHNLNRQVRRQIITYTRVRSRSARVGHALFNAVRDTRQTVSPFNSLSVVFSSLHVTGVSHREPLLLMTRGVYLWMASILLMPFVGPTKMGEMLSKTCFAF